MVFDVLDYFWFGDCGGWIGDVFDELVWVDGFEKQFVWVDCFDYMVGIGFVQLLEVLLGDVVLQGHYDCVGFEQCWQFVDDWDDLVCFESQQDDVLSTDIGELIGGHEVGCYLFLFCFYQFQFVGFDGCQVWVMCDR